MMIEKGIVHRGYSKDEVRANKKDKKQSINNN